MKPWQLSATEAVTRIRSGDLTSEELIRSCLERYDECEPDVRAFSHLDPDRAIAQARETDKSPTNGPLNGVPVGIKDIIDTIDFPTRYNSPIYKDNHSGADASCVTELKAAGAVIMGKVDTVEFASLGRHPRTGNPHNTRHTPGGSSAGSAAVVAAGMVPVAIGTQTGGSTIRPASFCGVFGMKPTFGQTSFGGIRPYAQSLDTIGWMGKSASDLALVAEALGVIRQPAPAPDISSLKIARYEGPNWDAALPESKDALDKATNQLSNVGVQVSNITGPAEFLDLTEAQDIVMHGEGRAAFVAEYNTAYHLLHQNFRDEVENIMGITPEKFRWAYDHISACRPLFDQAFDGYDAWLTPSVPGEAPEGLESGGEATFNRMWTALHTPCITIPSSTGPNDLPVGVQLVARRFNDQSLLAVSEVVSRALINRT